MIKILVVDDLEDNRLVIKNILKNIKDIEVFEVDDGQKAVDFTKENEPHIILMDIMMPNMDGFEATRIIKKDFPETIVMVITALEDEETEKKMIEAGANSYVKKPIDYDIVKYKIKNFINLIQIKRNTKTIFTKKNAINPFNNDIRNMKIFYYITNEDDMMDFGTWLIDYFNKHNNQISINFYAIVDFLYKIMINTLKNEETLTIVIEDGFDSIYVNFASPKYLENDSHIGMEEICSLKDNIVMKDGFFYLRINLLKKMEEADAVYKEPEVKDEKPAFIDFDADEKDEKSDNDDGGFIDFDADDSDDSSKEVKVTNYDKDETFEMNEHDRTLLRQSYTEKVSAVEFLEQIEGGLIDEIHDLVDLEEHWQDLIDRFDSKAEDKILFEISDILAKYSSVINSLYSFMALSYALSSLSTFLRNLTVDNIDTKTQRKFVLLLGCVKSDLADWRVNIFEEQTTQDIHYLDSSLFSSCMQIESLLVNKVAEDDEESDLELF